MTWDSGGQVHSTCSSARRTHRNLRRGLTKDPVELRVGRNVGDAHRNNLWQGFKRRGVTVMVANANGGMMCSAKTWGGILPK